MAEDYFLNNYKTVNVSGDVSNLVTKFMHRFLESGRDKNVFERVLEVGALNGEHTHFVKHNFSQYYVTDIRTPSQNTIEDLNRRGFIFQLADVENLPFENGFFDRVISTCLLHHLIDPEKGISEMLRVVKSGGTVDILVPNDPSLIYSASWLASTGVRAIVKNKFRESYLNRKNEHMQGIRFIDALLQKQIDRNTFEKKFFPKVFNLNKLTVLFRFTIVKS